jgi:hypothetical protein
MATTRTTVFVMLLLILGIGILPKHQGVEGFSVSTPPVGHRRSQPPSSSPTFLFQESPSLSSSNSSDDVKSISSSSSSSIYMDIDRDATVEGFMNHGGLLQTLLLPKKNCKVDQMSGTALGG